MTPRRARAHQPGEADECEVARAGQQILSSEPLLLDRRALARALGVSVRHITGMRVRGGLPAPLRLGSAIRWSKATIERWIAAGCPNAERFEALERKRGGSR